MSAFVAGMRRLSLFLLVSMLACGSDDVRIGGDGGALGESKGVQAAVMVTLEGVTEEVLLSELVTVEIDGEGYIRLSEVVVAAFGAENLAQLQADFEAGDGFTPGIKDFCKEIVPVDGATLAQGYVHAQSRNMRWDDAFSYPGCMSPADLAIITLTRKP